jgi:hypothetical protein
VAIAWYDPRRMIQISRFLIYYGSISSVMHKQITVGVFFMIALTAIGTIEQAVQSVTKRYRPGWWR